MIWKALDWLVDTLATLFLVAMSLVLALEVVCRYLFNRPLTWSVEVSLFCFVWLVWLGAIGYMREEKQIRIDFMEKYTPVAVQRIFVPTTTFLSMLFLVAVVYYGVQVADSQRSAVFDILPFSRGVLYAAAPIGGTLMFLSLARVLLRQIRRYYGVRNA